MRTLRLSFLLFCFLISTSISYAKFCSECGKTLNEDAKFCSECGAGVNGNTRTNANNDIDKSSVQFVYEKLKSLDEFYVYLTSSNPLTCMQKFPDCKFKFEEGLKELQKENLSDLQKILIDMYKLEYDQIEICYKNVMNFDESYQANEALVNAGKIKKGITEVLSNRRDFNWCKTYLKAYDKSIELSKTNFNISAKYLILKDTKVFGKSVISIIDVDEDRFQIICPNYHGTLIDWIPREEIYKRTTFKKRPTEKIVKEIDEIQKLLK